ncbi:hypothetical protein D187_006792 [Cystobacter fuscus DSM 2262]|uniref:Uncharacterized protein n=1 Tax=Cystobacter fuscus (strain ATCC 25194 / DSM 2262 / NBRC 100088 / M29) TaxID=1242864 RepID=S9QKP1_CYSF2|nr:hypothetical protein D187_006792 [Cystobacter fuscus DSM 2262]
MSRAAHAEKRSALEGEGWSLFEESDFRGRASARGRWAAAVRLLALRGASLASLLLAGRDLEIA